MVKEAALHSHLQLLHDVDVWDTLWIPSSPQITCTWWPWFDTQPIILGHMMFAITIVYRKIRGWTRSKFPNGSLLGCNWKVSKDFFELTFQARRELGWLCVISQKFRVRFHMLHFTNNSIARGFTTPTVGCSFSKQRQLLMRYTHNFHTLNY